MALTTVRSHIACPMAQGGVPPCPGLPPSFERELGEADCAAEVAAAVRHHGRRLVDADGITFVLRDGQFCFYLDEDAISPLWKGGRFPIETCVSGWVMTHRQPVIIPNIFMDDRVPHAVYRRTFVKSLMMVPVGDAVPVAAVGAYWAEFHDPTDCQILGLFRLARAASDAMACLPPVA